MVKRWEYDDNRVNLILVFQCSTISGLTKIVRKWNIYGKWKMEYLLLDLEQPPCMEDCELEEVEFHLCEEEDYPSLCVIEDIDHLRMKMSNMSLLLY